jgi:prostaglandin-E synthase 1
MLNSPIGPGLVAYAVTLLVLSANLVVLWAASGAARNASKAAINPEDAALFKVPLLAQDPPAVARVLRAHANAQATIYPFLFLGLTYVLVGGSALVAWIIFAIFVVARIVHSIVYLAGKQPWRTIAFSVSGLALIALAVALIWRLVVHG